MHTISHDLQNWIPRLLTVWRRHRRGKPGPADRLTPAEAGEVTRGIRHLSAGLTRNRVLAGEHYLSDPVLLGAYLLYFWPVSYAQARYTLRDLPARPKSVLDLGSGPGPLGAACLDLGAEHVTFADRSRPAVALAGELARAAGKRSARYFWDPLRGGALPERSFDLITFGHVLNELWPGHPDRIRRRADLAAKCFAHLTPRGFLFMLEPALTPTARDLLAVRDLLLERGFVLAAPCLWRRACPALAKPEDTCHDEFAWSPPPVVQDLIRRSGFQKKSLKSTALLWAAAPPGAPEAPDERMFRIVSEPMLSKNRRVRLLACGPAGRLSLALKPEQATDDTRDFLTLKRGDVIRLHNAQPRPGGLSLVPGARLEVLRRSSDRP